MKSREKEAFLSGSEVSENKILNKFFSSPNDFDDAQKSSFQKNMQRPKRKIQFLPVFSLHLTERLHTSWKFQILMSNSRDSIGPQA